MTFESEEFNFVAIYIWMQPASYVVFLTTLVSFGVISLILLSIFPRQVFVIRPLSPTLVLCQLDLAGLSCSLYWMQTD